MVSRGEAEGVVQLTGALYRDSRVSVPRHREVSNAGNEYLVFKVFEENLPFVFVRMLCHLNTKIQSIHMTT